MEPLTSSQWLASLQSSDVDVRNAAARNGAAQGANVVAAVADLMGNTDKSVARAATRALQHIAHYATRPRAPESETQRVAQALMLVAAAASRPRMVRSEALNALGLVGNSKIVASLASLLGDSQVRDDARMALERIPGPQAQRALEQALKQAPADFQTPLRQSLYNRSLSTANVGTKH